MSHQNLMIVSISLLATLALGSCTIDLVPIGRPDLTGPPGFCKIVKEGPDRGKLVVTVKNQGTKNAPASITTVEFSPGGSFQLTTPPIPAGGTVDLSPLSIPGSCFNSDCDFKITVDSKGQVKETNEGNNTGIGNCLG